MTFDEDAVLLGAQYYTNPFKFTDELFYFKFENNLWYYFYKKQWFIADQKVYKSKFEKGLMKVINLC